MEDFKESLEDLKKFLNSFTVLQIEIQIEKKILFLQLNRPKHLNALNETIFEELEKFFSNFSKISNLHDIRAIVLAGNGKAFSSGLDLKSKIAMNTLDAKNDTGMDVGRKAYNIYNSLKKLQDSLSSMERCPVPIIASVHGYCLGGAMSILCCADVRVASKSSKFSIKEIDIGLTADLGAIQRLIKQTGKEGLIKKYTFTGETFNADKAFHAGIVEEVVESDQEALRRSFELAELIATKSPLVLWGIKRTIHFARDNSVKTSLDMVATMNSALIQSDDISDTIKSFLNKTKAMYPKL